MIDFQSKFFTFTSDIRARGLDFDPLHEIVDGHQQELVLTGCEEEKTKVIHPPTSKWPWGADES